MMPLKPHSWRLRDGYADPSGVRKVQMVMAFRDFKPFSKSLEFLREPCMNDRFGEGSGATV